VSYFVQIPSKYRNRPTRKAQHKRDADKPKLPSVWTFGTESEAIEFAKSFKSCWVEVRHEGRIIYKNYPDKVTWMSEAEATVVREQNKQSVIDNQKQEKAG